MDRAGIPFGLVAILAGLGIGYLMLAFPDGANPGYPIWVALLAPLAFVLGGLLVIAHSMGHPSLTGVAVKALALCLLALVNWAAFFSSHIQCRVVISFLGVAILERYPTEAACRDSLRIVIACMDALILLAVLVFAWGKFAGGHGVRSR